MGVAQIKQQVDCRQLVEADLGDPKRRGSKAWQWRCPFHYEQKGYSLAAWANGWRCFGACQFGGDAIAWLQHYRGLDFAAACHALGAPEENRPSLQEQSSRALPSVRSPATVVAQPPSTEWHTAAWKIIEEAEATLWRPAGERTLEYLRQQRGLFQTTIREAQLGYIPGHYCQWCRRHGLNVPCGITIPWIVDGDLWAIKVRRAAGQTRYEQVAGGNLGGSLYWADNVLSGWPVLLVEGEFNCLIAWQEAMDLTCPVSLGSASTALNPHWYAPLATSPLLLACYDQDAVGEKASARLRDLTARAKFIHVPQGKDINEYYVLNRSEPLTIYRWLNHEIQ